MLQNTFNLDVDIKEKNYLNEPIVTQNDRVTYILRVFDNGVPFNLADVTVFTLVSVRPDKVSVQALGTMTANNEVTFDLGTTEISVPGRVEASIQLYDADGRVSSIPFTYKVLKDPMRDYVPSEKEKTLIELVLSEGPRILVDAEQATIYASNQGDYAKTEADKLATLNAAVTDNEATRIANEQVRQTNESERLSDETDRASSESDRISNEDARILSETARQDAEAIRVSQEAQRQTDTSQAIVEALDAAEQAHNAQGPQGIQGPKGDQGIQGEKGDKGEPGKDGDGAGTVTSVNDIEPDEFGNVDIGEIGSGGVKSVNEKDPDASGDVTLTTEDINYRHDLNANSLPSEFPVGVTLSPMDSRGTSRIITYRTRSNTILQQLLTGNNINSREGQIASDEWDNWVEITHRTATEDEAIGGINELSRMTPFLTKKAIEAQVTSELVTVSETKFQDNFINFLTPDFFDMGRMIYLSESGSAMILSDKALDSDGNGILTVSLVHADAFSSPNGNLFKQSYCTNNVWSGFSEWFNTAYQLADKSMAEQGNNNTRLMTPKRTKEAIDYHVGTKMYRGPDEPTLTPDDMQRGGQFWFKEV